MSLITGEKSSEGVEGVEGAEGGEGGQSVDSGAPADDEDGAGSGDAELHF